MLVTVNGDSSFYLVTTPAPPRALRHDGHQRPGLNIGEMKGRRSIGTHLPLLPLHLLPLPTRVSFCSPATTIICRVTPRELGSSDIYFPRPAVSVGGINIQPFPGQNLALSGHTMLAVARPEGEACSVAIPTFRFNAPMTDFSRVTSMEAG